MLLYKDMLPAAEGIAVDEMLLTVGTPTTAGSRMLADYRSLFEAEAITRLRAAGIPIVGKTAVGEFGIDLLGETCYTGACVRDGVLALPAAEAIRAATPAGEEIYATLAPPDLFGRVQESGKTRADLFRAAGVPFVKSSNDRLAGWLAVKELLRKAADGLPRLRIFRTCAELCRCLPMLLSDPARPGDVLTEPHAITHAPDALRGFAVYHSAPQPVTAESGKRPWSPDMWQDYYAADDDERRYLIKKYGEPL